ncbi:MAG: serine hydroxymethyltransferase, partial [Planctomycetes bacterium]|nr:serine hydroxymethyltransferase [Planctomycetota bacterium]
MGLLESSDPDVFGLINEELSRQQAVLNLIASENHTSRAVLEATAAVLTDKYAEGYPHERWYG